MSTPDVRPFRAAVVFCVTTLLVATLPARAEMRTFNAEEKEQLKAAEYVYVSSTRKDGTLGSPAEIWFMPSDDSVYVGTRPTSWRAKRIGWGRPRAKIAIGSREGPTVWGDGEIVKSQEEWDRFCAHLAEKYPSGWKKYEKGFVEGFKTGDRVLIRYRATTE